MRRTRCGSTRCRRTGTSGVELDPRALICEDKGTAEVGGTLDEVRGSGTVVFEPPNTLGEAPVHFGHPPDEVEKLVQAIAEGRAQDEGATQLDGRAVHRIRLDPDPPSECPYSSCPEDPAYVFVDAETFALVEVHGHGLLLQPDGPIWFRAIVRYETYEYLPRTPANLALTDIRAQHPDAIQR